jgi:pimeloyl-ACP methyl ester carboxylesterase
MTAKAARPAARYLRRFGVPLVVLYVVVQVVAIAVLLIQPRRGEQLPPKALHALAIAAGGAERLSFVTRDGIQLAGELLGNPRRDPLVVFGHGYRCNRRMADTLALDLLDRGFAVLSFDFRGCGGSGGTITTAGALEGDDVVAVLDLLLARGISLERVAYVGFSMGAVAALEAGERIESLGALVLIAPYADMLVTFERRTRRFAGIPIEPLFTPALWLFTSLVGRSPSDVKPIDRIAELAAMPVLLIGGDRDWRSPLDELTAMRDRRAGGADFVLVHDAGHYDLASLPVSLRERILEWLERHLPPRPAR